MYKLNFFVLADAKERVKEALFKAGAGRYEKYEQCSFETLGVGQFKPIEGAHPHIGEPGRVEYVQEYKIEMICQETLIKEVIATLKEVHPYEEVAYEVFRMEEF